jgi:hypothetical protein
MSIQSILGSGSRSAFPARIKIEQLPENIPLVAGMTATVTVRDGKDNRWSDISSGWSALVGGVSDLFRCTQDIQKSLATSAHYGGNRR